MDKCPKCGKDAPDYLTFCVCCGAHVGYPNVRAAHDKIESQALRKRFDLVIADAVHQGSETVLKQFAAHVAKSEAVFCRSFSYTLDLASSDSVLHTTFYRQVEACARLPEHNQYDKMRESVDAMIFPHYHKEMRFAALSTDGHGPFAYGECAITLSDFAVKERASVFEENSINFVNSHRIVLGGSLPPGYRAGWDERHILAVAKLGRKITATTSPGTFPKLLLDKPEDPDPDLVEVHIYGPVHRTAVRQIAMKKPKKKSDRTFAQAIRTKLKGTGATVIEV